MFAFFKGLAESQIDLTSFERRAGMASCFGEKLDGFRRTIEGTDERGRRGADSCGTARRLHNARPQVTDGGHECECEPGRRVLHGERRALHIGNDEIEPRLRGLDVMVSQ